MSVLSFNLLVRFLLEVIALVSIGVWSWRQTDHWSRYLLAIAIPVILAVIWGTFAVPDDPSRSGNALVPVSGWIRLVLEFSIFGLAAWSLSSMSLPKWSLLFVIIVVIHYMVSYDRITWLLNQ